MDDIKIEYETNTIANNCFFLRGLSGNIPSTDMYLNLGIDTSVKFAYTYPTHVVRLLRKLGTEGPQIL